MLRYLTTVALTLSCVPLFAACGEEAEEEVRNTVNCAKICAKYDECVAETDVTACTDSCEDAADTNENYARQASACDACVGDDACAEAQGCWASCPVVAVQD